MKTYKLSIITPEETVYCGQIQSLFLPSVCGKMEVLAEHAPAFIMLDKGVITVHIDGANIKSYNVESGYAQITRNEVKILPENITLIW
jgi:F-type H+-transporting ATPase subunit epsilon